MCGRGLEHSNQRPAACELTTSILRSLLYLKYYFGTFLFLKKQMKQSHFDLI